MHFASRKFLKKLLLKLFPAMRRLQREREDLARKLEQLSKNVPAGSEGMLAQYREYVDTLPQVVQYRQAYFETRGQIVVGAGVPTARAWPKEDKGISYADKLSELLELSNGKGAELGPLTIPIVLKDKCNVLYVDHLTTEELRKKYPTFPGLVEIDRPMTNGSLKETLQHDAPLDYVVASQVFEHVPNPIRWLQDLASVLRTGGLLALSLPDRRMTFDFLRTETQAADIVAAYFEDAATPNVRSVYDHHSLASYLSFPEGNLKTIFPHDIVAGRGAVSPKIVTEQHLPLVHKAKNGEYLDVHAWVFTPPTFLLVMAQLAGDGFLPFRLRQFYPTNPKSLDRGSSSFTIVLEKVTGDFPIADLRRSYLDPLGE